MGWRGWESNPRHHDFQSCALPTELPRPEPLCGAGKASDRRAERLIALGHAQRSCSGVACVALLAAAFALSGGSRADPATPPAIPGLPPPFLGTAVVGDGQTVGAVDAYGDVVDVRPLGTPGKPLLQIPAELQAAGTVPADSGIVARAHLWPRPHPVLAGGLGRPALSARYERAVDRRPIWRRPHRHRRPPYRRHPIRRRRQALAAPFASAGRRRAGLGAADV